MSTLSGEPEYLQNHFSIAGAVYAKRRKKLLFVSSAPLSLRIDYIFRRKSGGDGDAPPYLPDLLSAKQLSNTAMREKG
ncbi:hypothetical protein V9T40_008024 [Parthenolecanium corni]|uniref:Uncharacterized protein n=1 Tax=Parthenolecanium corni TaxID=536013 RepID=A0AAN9Y9H6_9HEMI